MTTSRRLLIYYHCRVLIASFPGTPSFDRHCRCMTFDPAYRKAEGGPAKVWHARKVRVDTVLRLGCVELRGRSECKRSTDIASIGIYTGRVLISQNREA